MVRWQLLLGLAILSLLTACQPTATVDSSPPDSDSAALVESATDSEAAVTPATSDPAAAKREEQAAAALSDTTVVPGDRVGPITADTSRADLAARFGEALLEDTEVAVGEGFTESGTIVNAGSDRTFAVIWVDDSQSEPATVKDFGTAWQTPEGIGVGTSFAELQALLGPFDLYGFGWDYGGTLVLEGSNLSNYYGSLILRLQPTDPSVLQQQAEAFAAVRGDKLISSDEPNLVALDLVVDEMIVYLNPPAQ